MQHRHLLPNEIDLLLDGEAGFGVAVLRAHLDECRSCSARLADARVVVAALERLPHFAPSLRFSDAVMEQVQVVAPLHIAALDTLRQWLPRSTPMRVLVGVGAGSAAVVVTSAALWIAFRADAAMFVYNLFASRVRAAVVGAASGLVRDAFGSGGSSWLPAAGSTALLVGAAVALLAATVAAFGLLSRTVSLRRVRR